MLDTEKNVIDNQFLHCTVGEYLDARNENCRTRGQKQKNLLFTFKIIGDGISQPMEIADDEPSEEHGVPVKYDSPHINSMDLDTDSLDTVLAMYTANDVKEPPSVPEDPDMPSVVEMIDEDNEPSMYKMPVRFLEEGTNRVFMDEKYDKRATMDHIVNEFVTCYGLNINNVIFSTQNAGLLHIAQRPLELYIDCDQAEMDIYFKVEEIQSRTSKRATSREQSKTIKSQQKKSRIYLTFKDQTANRDPIDLDFEEKNKFSLAIKRIAEVMELDRSKSHFFNANGMFHSFPFSTTNRIYSN